MAKIDKKIFKRITKHKKITPKYANDQTIRVLISSIHTQNPGLTHNAAAHIFAQKHKVSVFRYLSDGDKNSLRNYTPPLSSLARNSSKRTVSINKTRALKLPFDEKLVREAQKNMAVYPYVYILENYLRQTIMDTFNGKKDWWRNNQIVHPDIQKYAKKIHDAESKYKWMPSRGKHPIYYVGLYELFKIIEKNWKDFKKIFVNLENLRTWINETVPIRHLIAHNVPARKVDFDNARIRTTHICTMIEKSYPKNKHRKK